MKSKTLLIGGLLSAAVVASAVNWTEGMKEGKPDFKSMGPLAFAPDGVLLVADTKGAAVVAIATGDTKPAAAKPLKIESINQKVAALLGTSSDKVLIDDMAANPISHNVYLAVSRGRGPSATPVLARVNTDGQIEIVDLEKVKYSRGELPDAPIDGVVGEANRSSNPRQESITDIAFFQDRVLIAGLSNEEFASTLRAIPFPFKTIANGSTVEIYHGAHGRFETRAPVRTFVPLKVGNEPTVLAAYTCTPLVQFTLGELKPGAKVKGKTVAELGNRNRPIDMIVYQKEGKDYLLLANSSRGVMKISTDNIENAESITAPVRGGGTKGQSFETIQDWKGIDQLDQLDATRAVVVRRAEGGALNLESLPLP
jgi:hypothetical protein